MKIFCSSVIVWFGRIVIKGVYIKYVGGGWAEGFTTFFKKKILAQRNTVLKSYLMVGPATFLKNSSWSILLILVSWLKLACGSHCMKCPYSELFWSAFSLIRTEYGEIQNISSYSI